MPSALDDATFGKESSMKIAVSGLILYRSKSILYSFGSGLANFSSPETTIPFKTNSESHIAPALREKSHETN